MTALSREQAEQHAERAESLLKLAEADRDIIRDDDAVIVALAGAHASLAVFFELRAKR